LTAPPSYFFHDAAKNKEAGLSLEAILRNARALTPQEVEAQSEEGVLLLDTRAGEAFKQGHLPGAVQVGLDGNFAPYVGTVVSPHAPLIVIAEKGREEEAMTRLVRVGYENILGWLAGGMDDWRAAGGEVVRVETRQPADLKTQENITVVDVRTQSEWDAGHLEGAIHIPLAELVNRLDQLPPEPFAVLCGSGYRSVIALSLLLRQGYRAVTDIAGGWKGYTALG
jgi:rhodanese-related sulfurtransferase